MQENSINIEKGDILFGPLWPNQIKPKDIEKINDNCFKLIFFGYKHKQVIFRHFINRCSLKILK
jgi:hypothetical protein